jgi:glutathione synthase/RimK-type ligase-like ATP-grasp enzyme
MTIAIHYRKGSYSDKWIQYCKENNIDYKIINCFKNNLIPLLNDCDALLWHWSHTEHESLLSARSIIKSLENKNILVYPNYHTCWHYDDKISQKYLLESIKVPFVPTYIFYTKSEALKWINDATFPKIFKLKTGAASQNVRMVRKKSEAKKITKKAFKSGFNTYRGYLFDVETRLRKTAKKRNYFEKIKRLPKVILSNKKRYRLHPRQIGYIYFQEYLPNNEYDTRIVIIGDRAFGLRRFNRPGDFRASGGGLINYDKSFIDERMIDIAFKISKMCKFQTMAYDFLYDENRNPVICEISYGFPKGKFLEDCPGYWSDQLKWIDGNYIPEYLIIENIINEIRKGNK